MRNPEWSALELVFGTGLLLGPLVYALTLEPAPAPAPRVATPEPVAAQPVPEAPVCEADVAQEIEPPSAPEPATAGDPDGAFLFVTRAGVVLTTDADPSWGRGRVRGKRGTFDGDVAAWRKVDVARIPERLWRLRGRPLDLYGPHGLVCRARIGELELVAQFSGWYEHLLSEEELELELDLDEIPERRLRQHVFRSEPKWLVGSIESADDCSGAVWARDSGLPAPVVYAAEDVDVGASDGWLAALVDELESSDEYRAIEREYRDHLRELEPDERSREPSWPMFVRDQLDVRAWIDRDGMPRFVQADLYGEPESCEAGFYGRLTRSWAVDGNGRAAPIELAAWPQALADVDGDGRLESVFADGAGVFLDTESPGLPEAAIVPFTGCPC